MAQLMKYASVQAVAHVQNGVGTQHVTPVLSSCSPGLPAHSVHWAVTGSVDVRQREWVVQSGSMTRYVSDVTLICTWRPPHCG